jgi:hypothetical protein
LEALPPQDRAAMKWVSENTKTDSAFLVLTPPTIWAVNEKAEWFPTLTRRVSVSTVQGTEWISGDVFNQRREIYEAFEGCVIKDLGCIAQVALRGSIDHSYIYLSGKLTTEQADLEIALPIEQAIRNAPDYKLIYDQDGVLIFQKLGTQNE